MVTNNSPQSIFKSKLFIGGMVFLIIIVIVVVVVIKKKNPSTTTVPTPTRKLQTLPPSSTKKTTPPTKSPSGTNNPSKSLAPGETPNPNATPTPTPNTDEDIVIILPDTNATDPPPIEQVLCPPTIPDTLKHTPQDTCNGITIQCEGTKWVKKAAQKCTDVYSRIPNGTAKVFNDYCQDKAGSMDYIKRFACTDTSGVVIDIKNMCVKEPPVEMQLTNLDRCKGLIKLGCTEKGWDKIIGDTCEDIYRANLVGSENDWNTKCASMVGQPGDINRLTCKNTSDGAAVTIKKLCSKEVPVDRQLTDVDRCNGMVLDCSDNGWGKVKTTLCDTVYKGVGGVNMNDWIKFCSNKIGDQNFINSYNCTDNKEGVNITIRKSCPKNPPPDNFSVGDKCMGYGWVCDDSKGVWVKDFKYDSCDAMYRNATNVTGASASLWKARCKDLIGDNSTYNSDILCVDTTNQFNVKAVKGVSVPGCKKNPPPGSCKDAKGNDGKCPPGMVCMCDSTTSNNWKCVPQKPGSACVMPQGALCIDNNGDKVQPMCVQCNSQTITGGILKELVCPNSAPSAQCLTTLYNVISLSAKDKTGKDISFSASTRNNVMPIYPLYNNTVCGKGDTPFDDMTPTEGDNYIGHMSFANPMGWVDKDWRNITSNTMKYYDLSTPIRKFKSITGYDCLWSDDEIVRSLDDPGQSVCRGRGTFVQDNVKGELQKSGTCNCNPGFAGPNCQYDASTCNNRGTPVNDNTNPEKYKCNCNAESNGNKCQYTKLVTCYNRGNPTMDGLCTNCSGSYGAYCQHLLA